MVRVYKMLAALVLLCFGVGNADARTYYLPDYQNGNFSRAQSNDKQPTYKAECSDFGFYTAPQSGLECTSTSPDPNLVCYSCSGCDAGYIYSEEDCPENKYNRSSSCAGKYKSCTCKTNLYPATSVESGCPEGQVVTASSSCTDKPSGTLHYSCEKDYCPGMLTVEACEAQGGHCIGGNGTMCSARCKECLDNCEYALQYQGAVNNCDLGCAPGKEISGCPGVCEAGGCKILTCDEGYTLNAAGTACEKKELTCREALNAAGYAVVEDDSAFAAAATGTKPMVLFGSVTAAEENMPVSTSLYSIHEMVKTFPQCGPVAADITAPLGISPMGMYGVSMVRPANGSEILVYVDTSAEELTINGATVHYMAPTYPLNWTISNNGKIIFDGHISYAAGNSISGSGEVVVEELSTFSGELKGIRKITLNEGCWRIEEGDQEICGSLEIIATGDKLNMPLECGETDYVYSNCVKCKGYIGATRNVKQVAGCDACPSGTTKVIAEENFSTCTGMLWTPLGGGDYCPLGSASDENACPEGYIASEVSSGCYKCITEPYDYSICDQEKEDCYSSANEQYNQCIETFQDRYRQCLMECQDVATDGTPLCQETVGSFGSCNEYLEFGKRDCANARDQNLKDCDFAYDVCINTSHDDSYEEIGHPDYSGTICVKCPTPAGCSSGYTYYGDDDAGREELSMAADACDNYADDGYQTSGMVSESGNQNCLRCVSCSSGFYLASSGYSDICSDTNVTITREKDNPECIKCTSWDDGEEDPGLDQCDLFQYFHCDGQLNPYLGTCEGGSFEWLERCD